MSILDSGGIMQLLKKRADAELGTALER